MIRKASEQDCEAFLLLRQQAILALAKDHYTPEQLDDWAYSPNHEKISSLLAQETFFVGEDSAGTLICGGAWNGHDIEHFYVSPAYSRQGWGKRLLSHIEQDYRARTGHAYIDAQASYNARPFYESQGYTYIKTGMMGKNGISSRYDLLRKTFPAS